jgi:hypothetical protein
MVRRMTAAVARVPEVEEPPVARGFVRTGIGCGAPRFERETAVGRASVSRPTQPYAAAVYEELEKRRRRAQIRARRALSLV